MHLKNTGMGLLLGSLALAGCKYEFGTAAGPVPMNLTCISQVLDQTIQIRQGETLYSYETSEGEEYYGLTRTHENVTENKAVTTTVTTSETIKMYDHDRWSCSDDQANRVDYKALQPNR